jgi:excisionase family DNA binding protein
VEDLALFLGVPVNTVYKWRSGGCGPHGYRVGRHLRFNERDVLDWLETRREKEL